MYSCLKARGPATFTKVPRAKTPKIPVQKCPYDFIDMLTIWFINVFIVINDSNSSFVTVDDFLQFATSSNESTTLEAFPSVFPKIYGKISILNYRHSKLST